MDIANLEFQLGELHEHAERLLSDIRTGKLKENDDAALAVDLGHLLDHICLAWNLRRLKTEEFSDISDSAFLRASNAVPNFGGERILIDFQI